MDVAEIRSLLRQWTQTHPAAVLWDESAEQVVDVYSGKLLPLPAARIEAAESRANQVTGASYLVLLRDDGVQIVLADVGVAWAPDTSNSGPVPGLPPVACWRDFSGVLSELERRLRLAEEPPGPEAVQGVLFGVAVLDGARRLGFRLGEEERRLDLLLAELEARRRG